MHVLFELLALASLLSHAIGPVSGTKPDVDSKVQQCRGASAKSSFRVAADVCQEAAGLLAKGSDQAEMYSAQANALRHLSRTKQALRACENALHSDPSNQSALLLKAELSLRLGDHEAASRAAGALKDKNRGRSIADQAATLKKDLQRARSLAGKKQWPDANRLFDGLLAIAPESSALLSEHADCLIAENQLQRAVDILRREAGIVDSDSSASLMTLSRVLLAMGNVEGARRGLLAAIRDDPELKPARALRKRIDELAGELKAALQAPLLKLSVEALEGLKTRVDSPLPSDDPCHDPRFPHLFRAAFLGPISAALCLKYGRLGEGKKGLDACLAARDLPAANAAASLSLGETFDTVDLSKALVESLLAEKRFDEALKEAKALAESNRSDDSLIKLARRCADELRRSKLVDYYAVLGLKKEASPGEVKKAYKRLSKRWHPDKHQNDLKTAEDKMREINRAYSILGDEKKRRIYDQTGVDPEDPEAQAQAQAAQGGFGFGGFPGGGNGFGGFAGFPGFDFGDAGGGGNFHFVFRDAQGREWRQQGSGGSGFDPRQHQRQRQQHHHQQQQKRSQWQWKDDL